MSFDDNGSISRRGVLRLGGLTVAMAALISACNSPEPGALGRVGLAPTTTKLPDASVNDTTLLRTCASLQYSLAELYTKMESDPSLLDPANGPVIARLLADTKVTAKLFNDLVISAGGSPWTCGNSKFDSALLDPAVTRITTGTPATPEGPAIGPSDDPKRDMLNLVQGMESIVASTYQQYSSMFNAQDLRKPTIIAAVHNSRHAALLALIINPGGYVSASGETAAEVSTDTTPGSNGPTTTGQDLGNTTTSAAGDEGAPQQTPIPPVFALPSTFGTTSTITVVVGAGDENGTRLKVLLQTPSLNSLEYDFLAPEC